MVEKDFCLAVHSTVRILSIQPAPIPNQPPTQTPGFEIRATKINVLGKWGVGEKHLPACYNF
jgi:hypothetical protein